MFECIYRVIKCKSHNDRTCKWTRHSTPRQKCIRLELRRACCGSITKLSIRSKYPKRKFYLSQQATEIGFNHNARYPSRVVAKEFILLQKDGLVQYEF